MNSPDLLTVIEVELHDAREDLARRADRVEALAALHRLALPVAAKAQRPIDIRDLHTGGEEQRAHVEALLERAIIESEEEEETWQAA